MNRHEFEDSRYEARESHANELTSLLASELASQISANSQIGAEQQPPPMPAMEPKVELPIKSPGKVPNIFFIVVIGSKIRAQNAPKSSENLQTFVA